MSLSREHLKAPNFGAPSKLLGPVSINQDGTVKLYKDDISEDLDWLPPIEWLGIQPESPKSPTSTAPSQPSIPSNQRNHEWFTKPDPQDKTKQRQYLKSLHSETICHPYDAQIDLTTPVFEIATDLERCANFWWYRYSSQRILDNFWSKKLLERMAVERSENTTISARDQLVRAVFAYFGSLGLIYCTASCCKIIQDRIRKVAPACRWQLLREAIITLIACWTHTCTQVNGIERLLIYETYPKSSPTGVEKQWQLYQETWSDLCEGFPLSGLTSEGNLGKLAFSRPTAGRIFPYITDTGSWKEEDPEIIGEIMSLVDWLDSFSGSKEREMAEQTFGSELEQTFLTNFQRQHSYKQASRMIQDLCSKSQNLCPNRLWNLALGSTAGCVAVVPVLQQLRKSNAWPSPKSHGDCTEQFCVVANEDTTSTHQLHKCGKKDCNPNGIMFQFPLDKLAAQFLQMPEPPSWTPTAWSIKTLGSLSATSIPEIIKETIHTWPSHIYGQMARELACRSKGKSTDVWSTIGVELLQVLAAWASGGIPSASHLIESRDAKL